jgi:hypothetical protein
MRIATLSLLVVLANISPSFAAADPACVAEIKTAVVPPSTLGPYEVTTDVDSPHGDTHTVMEVVAPIALHSSSDTGMGITEMTVIDNEGWMAFNGEWQAMAPEMVGMRYVFDDNAAIALFDTLTEAGCHGIVVLDSRPVTKFTYSYSVEGSGPISSELYIDAATGMPARSVIASKQDGATITVTSTFRFDATITVTPPVL